MRKSVFPSLQKYQRTALQQSHGFLLVRADVRVSQLKNVELSHGIEPQHGKCHVI